MSRKLLIILSDRPRQLLEKGEIIARYYNPGNCFDEIHFILTNDDATSPEDLQILTGNAKTFVHPLGEIPFRRTLHPSLFTHWTRKAIALADGIKPNMVRAYGCFTNAYIASRIKRHLRIPFILSLHTHPEENRKKIYHWRTHFRERLSWEANRLYNEPVSMESADCVIAVSRYLETWARKLNPRRIELIYNVINPGHLVRKENYAPGSPARIINVGRHIEGKDPGHLIEAMKTIAGHLTLVGQGENTVRLQTFVAGENLKEKVEFIHSISNDELCRNLHTYDIFVSINYYGGISKAVLEASMTGLPIVANRHPDPGGNELFGEYALLVEDSSRGYEAGIGRMLADEKLRERHGRDAVEKTRHLAPEKIEKQLKDLYEEFLQ